MKMFARGIFALGLAVSLLSACSGDDDKSRQGNSAGQPPSLADATLLTTLDKATLTAKFAPLGITPTNGVKIFRVSYNTVAPDNSAIKASGIIVVPDTTSPLFPWISLQHGTLARKADAPSLSPSEGLAEGSLGFVAVVPDYIGYGDTASLFHPYIVESAYAQPGVDMMRAAREFATAHSIILGPLFLKGYSEGGYATLALQKLLETKYSAEFKVLASAPSSGPYDPEAASKILMTKATINPINVPLLVLSYNQWLANSSLDLSAMFVPAVDKVKEALSGAYTYDEVYARLPSANADLFKADFTADFLSAAPTVATGKTLHTLLQSQSLVPGWVPKVPTRLYHCVDDAELPYEVTVSTGKTFKDAGAPVDTILIPSADPAHPYTHGTCPAIFAPLSWFGEILTKLLAGG